MGLLTLDRRIKPAPWHFDPTRVDPAWRWVWQLRPVVALPFFWEGDVTSRDHARLVPTATGGVWGRGRRGLFHELIASSDKLAFATDTFLPTTSVTVLMHYRKTDGTNRVSGAFGHPVNEVSNHRCGAHLPWSDGTVYWDFGSNNAPAEGTTRLSVAGLTFGDDVWAFTSGPRGMEIWQNGLRRASNAATPTRVNLGTEWGLGNHAEPQSDLRECAVFWVFAQQMSASQITALSLDPFGPFRPARRTALALLAPTTDWRFLDIAAGDDWPILHMSSEA